MYIDKYGILLEHVGNMSSRIGKQLRCNTSINIEGEFRILIRMNVHQNFFYHYDDNSLIRSYLSIVIFKFCNVFVFWFWFRCIYTKNKRNEKLFNYIKETNLVINMPTKI